MAPDPIRRCRRYLRPIDSTTPFWFHTFVRSSTRLSGADTSLPRSTLSCSPGSCAPPSTGFASPRLRVIETRIQRRYVMKRIARLLFAEAMVAGVIAIRAQTSARGDDKSVPQTAREVRGVSPYQDVKNEPPPRLIVDRPLPDLLDHGVVWIQWRAENVQILPVFGAAGLNVSPRVGHLHVQVDDLPWWWADPSNVNTIDMAGLPPGPHKVKISLVDANHEVFPGQSKTVTFTIPK